MKKIKMLLGALLLICMSACVEPVLTFDENYGVAYRSATGKSYLVVNLDTNKTGQVTSIYGTVYLDEKDMSSSAMDLEGYEELYYSYDPESNMETFRINPFRTNFNPEDYKSLFEALGLEHAYDDGVFTLKEDIVDNPQFRFAHFLKDAVYMNSIYLTGGDDYTVKDYH